MDPSLVDNISSKPSREDEIVELAKKELLRDIKCASMRAEQFGAHSWAKPQKYVPSKRFLKHMIVNDSRFNDRKEQRSLERREASRSRHSSSYIRHIEDQSEKSKSFLPHSRHSKKREILSDDEGVRNKREISYPENAKQFSGRKSAVYETYKEREIVSPNGEDRGINRQREKLSSSPEKHLKRKKHRKGSILVLDKKKIVSSDTEDELKKNVQSMSCDKEKHSKREKYRKTFPLEMDDKPSASHVKHIEKTKEMSSEEDKKITTLSRHRKKHLKNKTSKRQK